MMMGYDAEVADASGRTLLASRKIAESLTPAMRRRIEAIVRMDEPVGMFEPYPLFVMGEEIGTLRVRGLVPVGQLKEKEEVFKQRGRDFLVISFMRAGGVALLLSLLLSLFLTRSVKRLKRAAMAVAGGDLGVRVGAGRDEIGKLNRAFNHMVETLEREENLRKHLTSNIAHELRTPLTVMRANMEAVADGVVECDADTLRSLQAEVERLINLVKGIEDIAKAEASFFKRTEHEEVDVREMVEAVLQGMRPMFMEKGLSLEVRGGGGLKVSTDPEKLEVILRNIISNALKYTDRGGVRIGFGAEDGGFFVEVADTGRGISPEEREMVFRRFYKGEGSTGVGLGLAIARELADIMGGSIEVTSSPGQGSTFRVVLPG
jgi:two-component system sensor histidine kinase BaeS